MAPDAKVQAADAFVRVISSALAAVFLAGMTQKGLVAE